MVFSLIIRFSWPFSHFSFRKVLPWREWTLVSFSPWIFFRKAWPERKEHSIYFFFSTLQILITSFLVLNQRFHRFYFRAMPRSWIEEDLFRLSSDFFVENFKLIYIAESKALCYSNRAWDHCQRFFFPLLNFATST